MNVYRAEVEQFSSGGYKHASETYDVKARSMDEALKRVHVLCRGNGFLKSQPIHILSIVRTVEGLK